MIRICPESSQDTVAIHDVIQVAFDGSAAEPSLVEAIRESNDFIPELSLVAEEDGEIIGHILFSHIHIQTEDGRVPALSLAPMAVLPNYQNRGIGSALIRHGLAECKRLGDKIVIVLGHPDYYPRFGFSARLAKDLGCPYDAPEEAWMALELIPGALDGIRGKVIYPPAFEDA